MPGQGRTIYIAGAGIAGLTLAIALAKFGATVIVLEKSASIQEFGAGLQISPNARRILDRLGLDKPLAGIAFEPEAIDLYPFRRPKPLTSLKLGAHMLERYGAPYTVMHRADLVHALYRATRRFANIDILFGVRGFDAEAHSRGVSIAVEEAGGQSRTVRGFALVGADGVGSFTRMGLLEGPEPQYSGYVAWRALINRAKLVPYLSLERTSLLFGPGFHAVAYPLPHIDAVNVALFSKLPQKAAFAADPPVRPNIGKHLLPSAAFNAILDIVGDGWTFWPLSRVAAAQWHSGPIGLIGDAAHAMLPFQAQGAAMAIEDAALLAPLLVTEPDAESGFARYAAQRQPRTTKIAALSQRNGFAFHLEWPFSIGRDLVLFAQGPTGHLKRLDWVYSYDPAPEVEQHFNPREDL